MTHGVRLLSGVNAQVALQGLQVAEAGATGVTGVRFLPCVDQDVGSQMGDLHQTNHINRYLKFCIFIYDIYLFICTYLCI